MEMCVYVFADSDLVNEAALFELYSPLYLFELGLFESRFFSFL